MPLGARESSWARTQGEVNAGLHWRARGRSSSEDSQRQPGVWGIWGQLSKRLTPNPHAPGGARIELGKDAGRSQCWSALARPRTKLQRRFAASAGGVGNLSPTV